MSKFLKRVLGSLDALYGFEGSLVGTDQVDLARPITLVHDVSRGVSVASGLTGEDGYALITATHVHPGPGATDQYSSVDPYLIVDALRKQRSSFRVWALHSFADTDTGAAFTSAEIGQLTPVLPAGTFVSSRWQLWSRYDTTAGRLAAGANPLLTCINEQPNQVQYPVLMLPAPIGGTGGTVNFHSLMSAAGTTRLAVMCWIGPKGVDPPNG